MEIRDRNSRSTGLCFYDGIQVKAFSFWFCVFVQRFFVSAESRSRGLKILLLVKKAFIYKVGMPEMDCIAFTSS